MKRIKRDDTEHGVEYYQANEVDALLAEQPAQPQQEPDETLLSFYQATDFQSLVAAMEGHIKKLQGKLQSNPHTAIDAWNNRAMLAAAPQPAQQEPVQRYSLDGDGGMEIDHLGAWVKFTSPPQRKPDYKAFKDWANGEGYDGAYAHDGIKWVCLNPMTADLWKCWQAAHNIKE